MPENRFFFILSLTLFAFFFSGCQEGKKKDSPALVYKTGLAKCDQLAARLKPYDVNLAGVEEPQLPTGAQSGDSLVQVQATLEEYVLASAQLLELGDTKVVIFPEKARISSGNQRAMKYLGQLYALLNWGPDAQTVVRLRDVDWAELTVRQKRISTVLVALSGVGLALEDEGVLEHLTESLNKIETRKLELIPGWLEPITADALRAQELWKRNEFFQLESGSAAAVGMSELAKAFGGVKTAAQAELANRANPRTSRTSKR